MGNKKWRNVKLLNNHEIIAKWSLNNRKITVEKVMEELALEAQQKPEWMAALQEVVETSEVRAATSEMRRDIPIR